MSETPETDARSAWLIGHAVVPEWLSRGGGQECVDADFARRLERERDSYKIAWEQTDKTCHDLTEKVIPNLRQERDAARAELAENEAVIRVWRGRTERAEAERNEAREALRKIERWFGEFPPSGHFWPSGEEMSYGSAFGSNGERDYMRSIARAALGRAGGE